MAPDGSHSRHDDIADSKNIQTMRLLRIAWSLLRFWPHVMVYLRSNAKETIDYEIVRWHVSHHLPPRTGIRGLMNLLASFPEFRSLFYFRTKANWLSILAKGQTNLEFYTSPENIGKGLIIWHGFSTVVNVSCMGEDCQIWQNVTLGKKTSDMVDDRPVIGDRVSIAAGAIAVGEIRVADDVKIGAGAVVVKDVTTPGAIVVSQPVRYICH